MLYRQTSTIQSTTPQLKGFALPTVMIASVVMLMVLLSGLVAASSVNASLRQQYVDKVLDEAASAGRVMAEACLKKSGGVMTWTGKSLMPHTNCNGDVVVGLNQYIVDQKNSSNQTVLRSTFSIGAISTDTSGAISTSVNASIQRVRPGGAVSQTTAKAASIRIRIAVWKDLILLGNADSACGLSYNDMVYCWGDNSSGQLGDGTYVSRTEAKPIRDAAGNISSLRFKSLTNTFNAVCGVTTTDDGYCWGSGREGMMGTGDGSPRTVPTQIATGANGSRKWAKIDMLNYTTCGLGAAGNAGLIYCWGGNYNYNFGNGSTAASFVPVQASGSNYVDVSGGSHHVCGSAVGLLWCWGLRVNSAAYWYCRIPTEPDPTVVDCPGLGNRGFDTTTTNTTVSMSGIKSLHSGSDEMCLLATAGQVYCIGANFKGQAGDAGYGPDDGYGAVGNRSVPYRCVIDLAGSCLILRDLVHGPFSACGLDTFDNAWCWGLGQFGIHGDGPAGFTTDPIGGHVNDGPSHTVMGTNPAISSTFGVRVSGGHKFVKLFGGTWSFCGMKTDNQLYCWGRARNSIFGIKDGNVRYYTSPTLAPNALQAPPQAMIY